MCCAIILQKQNKAARLPANGGANDADMVYSSAALYQISRDELHEILEEGNLDAFEKYIRQVEESIFDGPFSAEKVEENLRLIILSEKLETTQKGNIDALHNSPFRDAVMDVFKELGMQDLANKIETGQQPRSNAMSLSAKKNDYQEVFDGMSETIAAIKSRLKEMLGKIAKDNRITALLERCEKCETEICKISGVMRNFA